jgi:hypothetical protein
MSPAAILLFCAEIYVIAGIGTALAFIAFGITRVLAEPMPATLGARILIFPGVAALWPYVLYRWLAAGRRR